LEDEEKSVRSAALCQYIHLLAEEVNSSASTKQSSTQQQTQTTQSSQQLQQQQQKIIPLQAIAARPIINASTQIEIVIPQIKKICLEKPENLLETICYEFGRFLWYTRESLTEEETNWFVNWFIKMSETKDNTIRSACAYNCPVRVFTIVIMFLKSNNQNRLF
jgi:hypothetical protein